MAQAPGHWHAYEPATSSEDEQEWAWAERKRVRENEEESEWEQEPWSERKSGESERAPANEEETVKTSVAGREIGR